MDGVWHLDNAVDKDAGRDDVFGIDFAALHEFFGLYDRGRRRHTHRRAEVTGRLVVGEIAQWVGDLALDERKVRLEPRLHHIGASLELPCLFALGQDGSHGRRRIERRDACSRCADAFGERSLRHDFEFNSPGAVEFGEHLGLAGSGERTDHPADLSVADERRKAHLTVAGIVVDDRQAGRTLVDQGMDQLDRTARRTEPADHHRRAVGDIGHGLGNR